MSIPLIGVQPTGRRVEIARSFSYKLNVGNYESRDFFCSQKSECAAEEAEELADIMYAFCRAQVLKEVKEYKAAMLAQQNRPIRREEIA